MPLLPPPHPPLQTFELSTPPAALAACGFISASVPVRVYRYFVPPYMAGGRFTSNSQQAGSSGDSVMTFATTSNPALANGWSCWK